MKAAVALIALVAVGQLANAGLLDGLFTMTGRVVNTVSHSVKGLNIPEILKSPLKLQSLAGPVLLEVFKTLCPHTPISKDDTDIVQNLLDSVHGLLDLSGTGPIKKGLTCLSHMSLTQFRSTLLTVKPPPGALNRPDTPAPKADESHVPKPTDAPVQKPTDAPVPRRPTDAPVQKPTDAPVPKPTDAPVQKPTDTPVPKPTEAPEPKKSEPVTTNEVVYTATTQSPSQASSVESVDWRVKGYVTPIKNQGICGSCWTFTATGAMEGALMRKTGRLPNLSEQNLLDCVRVNATGGGCCNGCSGGWPTDVYEWVTKNGGVEIGETYPYSGNLSDTCEYNAVHSAGKITSFQYTRKDDETDLKNKLATIGPIATAIDASNIQNYKSGIISCPNFTGLNHGVLIVGFGADPGTGEKFWLIKNSWGTSWGEQGYMRIARDQSNQCGIATAANYPIA